MKCKNCGASLARGSRVCINCGAVVNDREDLNFSDIPRDNYTQPKARTPIFKRVMLIILALAVIIGASCGSYFLFYQRNMTRENPELSFTGGQGIINGDESVAFVSIDNSSKLEFIHSVKLYEGAVEQLDVITTKPVSEDYKYTKNIDDSFRAIYFDLADFKLASGKNYTYTFEMTFSFYNDDNRYIYYQTVNFASSDKDISDVIFDHTISNITNDNQAISENEDAEVTNDYIYDNYWYSQPFKDKDNRTAINSLKFDDNGTCTVTYYILDDADRWSVTTYKGSFEMDGDKVKAKLDNGKSAVLALNPKARTLIPESTNKTLVERKHNSVINADELCK